MSNFYTVFENHSKCLTSQDTSAWTCPGDSGSPLVQITNENEAKVIGILHGSNHTTCTPTTYQSPSLFANLEYEENFDFIQRWLSVGYFMSAFEDNVLLNYMNQENVQLEDLWRIHPSSNLDIYESVFSGMYVFVF